MQQIGTVALIFGTLVGLGGAIWPAARMRRVLGLFTLAATSVALGIMAIALLRVDTRFAYVVQYTQQSAPLWLRIGALWSGASGSLLLWGWLASLLAVWLNFLDRAVDSISSRILLALGGLLSAACLAMGLYDVLGSPPLDGQGLSAALQDPLLIAHPPLVFIAYCGLAWLYGMSLSASFTPAEFGYAKKVGLVSWLLLSTAIWMGMCWAQHAQGWGTAWSWDAIETASLSAWLTLSASLIWLSGAQQGGVSSRLARIGLGLVWPVALVCTFAARGGQLISAHSYGSGDFGWWLLAIAVVLVLLSLCASRKMSPDATKENAALYAGILLVGMALATALGTLLPLLGSAAQDGRVAPPAYYIRVLAPLALGLAALLLATVIRGVHTLSTWKTLFIAGALAAVILAVLGVLAVAGIALGLCWFLAAAAWRDLFK